MKENIKMILLLDWIIFIVCYIGAIIFNPGEYGLNFIASLFITIIVDICMLIESIKFTRVLLKYLKMLCYNITVILILLCMLTPFNMDFLPKILQDILTVFGVSSIFFFIYDLIFNDSEYNTSKSALRPSNSVEDENVR